MMYVRSIVLLFTFIYCLPLAQGTSAQEVVDIYVSVVNDKAQFIGGLRPEHFRIYEDGKVQQIKAFSDQDEPATIAFMFDLSGSMHGDLYNSKLTRVDLYRRGVLEFLQNSRADNKYLLMSFGAHAGDIREFSGRNEAIDAIKDDGNFSRPEKDNLTRLFDSMTGMLENLLKSENRKRVLIILSDGEDNASLRSSKREIETKLGENPITVFSVTDSSSTVPFIALQGQARLIDLAEKSGGQSFFPLLTSDIATDVMNRIATMVKTQYRLSYVSANSSSRSNSRKLEVKLEISKAERKSMGRPKLLHRKRYIPLSQFNSSN